MVKKNWGLPLNIHNGHTHNWFWNTFHYRLMNLKVVLCKTATRKYRSTVDWNHDDTIDARRADLVLPVCVALHVRIRTFWWMFMWYEYARSLLGKFYTNYKLISRFYSETGIEYGIRSSYSLAPVLALARSQIPVQLCLQLDFLCMGLHNHCDVKVHWINRFRSVIRVFLRS